MVFYISLSILVLFVLWGIISPTNLGETAASLLSLTIEKFGWFYLLTTFSILIFSLYLAFSKYGKIRLGTDEDRPEYSNLSWFAMLLSAGMGIGLVFWGVAEPIQHYLKPPMGSKEGLRKPRLPLCVTLFFTGGFIPGEFILSSVYAWLILTIGKVLIT